MTDLGAGPSAWWHKLSEPPGEPLNPEAEAVRNALEKAAQIAESTFTPAHDLAADDEANVSYNAGAVIAKRIRALIPQDSKQPESS